MDCKASSTEAAPRDRTVNFREVLTPDSPHRSGVKVNSVETVPRDRLEKERDHGGKGSARSFC